MSTFHSAPRSHWPSNLVPGDLWLDVSTNPNTLYIVASDGSQVPVDALALSGNLRAESDPPAQRTATINFQIDNAGAILGTGNYGTFRLPVNAAIVGWTILADQAGSATVNILKSSFANYPTAASIVGTDHPSLASQISNENLAVSNAVWSTALLAGDVLQCVLTAASTITRLNVTLIVVV